MYSKTLILSSSNLYIKWSLEVQLDASALRAEIYQRPKIEGGMLNVMKAEKK
jgi:hypothetical protein